MSLQPGGLAGVLCQLRRERPLVGGARLAAGDIGRQRRKISQDAGRSQPQQHRHHHQVARAEGTVEPVGVAEASRKLT